MEQEERPTDNPKQTSRWAYLILLLIPGILSLIVAIIAPGNYGFNALIPVVFGCPAAGILAACIFATEQRDQSAATRVAIGVVMAVVFTVASAGLAYGGCFVSLDVMR